MGGALISMCSGWSDHGGHIAPGRWLYLTVFWFLVSEKSGYFYVSTSHIYNRLEMRIFFLPKDDVLFLKKCLSSS